MQNDQVTPKETATILELAEQCLPVAGDFVELGCYRGDTSVLLGKLLAKSSSSCGKPVDNLCKNLKSQNSSLAKRVLIIYNIDMNLSKRQEGILFAIIEEYAEVATPVGSVTLAKLFNVSSATIRAEMARLEEYGYIAQPHTSAGRVPTDAGYRYYVNALAEQPEKIADLEQLRGVHDDKPLERSNRVLEVRISSQERADYAIRGAVDSLVELTGNLGLATIGDQLYMSGIARLFTQPEFLDNQRVQAVAKLLDNLEPWLREAAPGQPLNIFIGQENPIGKTSQVSLIISRFRSPYSDRSYIGVLGPTRQNYARVMSLVRQAGTMLETALNLK